ncbi:glutaminyl-tRNA synthase (glutamine-hydrolyzing) subunit B [Candidatus Berkelbacteria bacterium RBG_13_40_8]|uniref:Aspartyl/glutamyl-tRNA(Asn/Gln) amidotransferase subunit B n=1 Tax=Candidatus Berkelbacteria bacterium RBG_13_40_8 TaxID=1797467 RepID=A0A1F5DMH4_9BACT|nr:MAG: glutaminyl-tRNA synthase (glutamine-hydrolyzing) subunit B [Candidatus Berkelbacteria bacterium RBG_13_40_8]
MNFKTVIGLEIHVQLKTKSKMFCGCDNNAESAEPNTLVCPVCLGLPGVLPVANKQAIEWVIKTGLALNCEIAENSKFDRKHYFYPDLPKNYQISQYDMPFCKDGTIEINNKTVRIKRIHLEEDAGKLIHAGGTSLVDLNRTGTPLMEIVTEPEIESPAEAKIFMQELRSILRYLDVSDADMEKGHLRCDANISIAVDDKEGVPTEIKNLNSFRMVERALAFEESRQKEDLTMGKKIIKETRGWDDKRGFTFPQRSKEIAQDYRYFPEPDLPPFTPKKAFDIEKLKKELPELPAAKRQRYQKIGIKISDAEVLASDYEMAEYFEGVAKAVSPTLAANWVINEIKSEGILIVSPENLGEMLQKLEKGEITGKIAKDVLSEMIESGKTAPEIIQSKGLKQMGDEGEIGKIIDKVISDNPKPVSDIKTGKMEAMGFLIGQVMRETKGSANPQIVNTIIKKKLE